MILYNNAFDLYHTIFRMLHLLNKVEDDKVIEIDRIRIWDYYLLFTNEILEIKPKKKEKEYRQLLKTLNIKKNNPYQQIYDQRKTLEKIKLYQMTALNCLASYNIIDKESLLKEEIKIISFELLKKYTESVGDLSDREKNIIAIMTSFFKDISLVGSNGLKERSNLIESKYDE
ncbi:ABC-three component system middle component 5 [Capnocytophaga canimorsus]|uniref:ABC-three component system middle component 5 n=1 Tax=Capnocytophaga canimorsus TaxID=28188 RepID=UPI0038589EB2